MRPGPESPNVGKVEILSYEEAASGLRSLPKLGIGTAHQSFTSDRVYLMAEAA
jgi:hypothetical protein